MANSLETNESFDGIEALLRDAREYVGVSEDLRPRVLEAVRLQCGEQRARRFLRPLALAVVLLALVFAEARSGLDDGGTLNGGLMAVGFLDISSPPSTAAVRTGDGDWHIIDALTKLRRQQARILRLEI